MSTIIDFFAAPNDAAAGEAQLVGPAKAFASVSFGGFDPEEAVVEWEELLTGNSAGEPRVVADQDDDGGCFVFALPPRLTAALADAEPVALRSAATAWTRLRAADGESIDAAVATAILEDLAALATGAGQFGHRLYCRVA
ncbi:hypothetical protein [Kitasatospora sp. NPDC004531]